MSRLNKVLIATLVSFSHFILKPHGLIEIICLDYDKISVYKDFFYSKI